MKQLESKHKLGGRNDLDSDCAEMFDDEPSIEEPNIIQYERQIQRKQEKETKRKKAIRAMRLVRKQGGL
jgi:hypothetical protein